MHLRAVAAATGRGFKSHQPDLNYDYWLSVVPGVPVVGFDFPATPPPPLTSFTGFKSGILMGFLTRLQTERITSMFGMSSFMPVSDVCGEQIGDHSPLGHTVVPVQCVRRNLAAVPHFF